MRTLALLLMLAAAPAAADRCVEMDEIDPLGIKRDQMLELAGKVKLASRTVINLSGHPCDHVDRKSVV